MEDTKFKLLKTDRHPETWIFALDIRARGWIDSDIHLALAWCAEHFGEIAEAPVLADGAVIAAPPYRWGHWGTRISITNPEDAMEFRIRWC